MRETEEAKFTQQTERLGQLTDAIKRHVEMLQQRQWRHAVLHLPQPVMGNVQVAQVGESFDSFQWRQPVERNVQYRQGPQFEQTSVQFLSHDTSYTRNIDKSREIDTEMKAQSHGEGRGAGAPLPSPIYSLPPNVTHHILTAIILRYA